MWAGGEPEGCAIALPRGCARGRRQSPAEGAPRRPLLGFNMLGPFALPVAPEPCRGCAGGGVVCHSPAEGVYQRWAPKGCRCWEPPHALGGLLCGQRGALEGCARGCRRGVAVGSRRMPWEASYVGGGVRRRGVP